MNEKTRLVGTLVSSVMGAIVGIVFGVLFMGWLLSCSPGVEDIQSGLEQKNEETQLDELVVTVYAYCPCEKCNTKKWAGMVATGQKMTYFTDRGINICAVDPEVIPLGTTIIYNSTEYLATDVGSGIKGNTIDILLDTHEDTIKFGVKKGQNIYIKR